MSSTKITQEEIELIKSAKAGSQPAFSRLFKMYKPFVEKLLNTYLHDMDESKDLTNIVFLKVYEKLDKFENYSSFGGWLRILAKNTAIDYLRTIKMKNESVDSEESNIQLPASYTDAETDCVNKMTYDYIISLISTLPPSYRKVCRLFYIENMTVSQISEETGIPSGTIKSDLFRMRKIFKKHLNL